jgi:hypothetical protein
LSVTEQVPVPEQPPPDQPEKVDPEAATAVRVTEVPIFTVSEQSEPQDMPVPVTLPDPVPDLLTVKVAVVG